MKQNELFRNQINKIKTKKLIINTNEIKWAQNSLQQYSLIRTFSIDYRTVLWERRTINEERLMWNLLKIQNLNEIFLFSAQKRYKKKEKVLCDWNVRIFWHSNWFDCCWKGKCVLCLIFDIPCLYLSEIFFIMTNS